MQELINAASRAATQVVGEVGSTRHVETLPTGEHVFATSRNRHDPVTVTLNPNGLRACVEWCGGYKVVGLNTTTKE